MASDLYIIVIGCGRLGAYLANQLSSAGNAVVVIDRNERAFGNLSPEFSGFRVEGDAVESAVLRQAKLDQADLVVATTRKDNVNLMVAQVAKVVFSVPRVLARVFNPKREEIYRRLGVECICPTTVAAEIFLRATAARPAAEAVR